jgi:hypothetical protein
MLFGEYRFSCTFENQAILPPYKGSTFRGVFGHSLKKVVCALKQNDCQDCLLRDRCVYVEVFETPETGNSSGDKWSGLLPHPFVIEPPETPQTDFHPGEPFHFSLLLFGKANQYLPYFIYAMDQMGALGMGKSLNGSRGRFCLDRVEREGNILYAKSDGKLKKPDLLEELCIQEPETIPGAVSRIRVTLKTPLRIKFRNHLNKADLPFEILVRAMLRRMSSLLNAYGEGEPALDYKGMVDRTRTVKTVEDHLEWYDWRRYSFRQDQAMLMGGMMGSAIFEGPMDEYMPLLDFCAKTHLGKQTSFGLGKIEVEILS